MTVKRDTNRRVWAAREMAAVSRCHVVQYHGDYTVGSHTHGALSLLFILHPNPSMDLVKALHFHDGAERWVGDMPSTAKAYSKELSDAYEAAEKRVLDYWGFNDELKNLTQDEWEWLRAVDALDLFVWAEEQMAMGNQLVKRFSMVLRNVFEKNRGTIPVTCYNFMQNYHWQRLLEMTDYDTE